METKKKHQVFVEGPITSGFIAESIEKHSNKLNIGAHSIFLGQVRNDRHDNGEVSAIEYTTYHAMAEEVFHHIREETFAKYALTCTHIYHSLGTVQAGEISLFVFTSSAHRADAISACEEIVERIKKEAPVWGKEILTDQKTKWKQNT